MSTAQLRPVPTRDAKAHPVDALAEVTIVTSHACHLCEDAIAELTGRAHELTLTVVGADTPAGLELVQRHRPVMFPLVLVDGRFLSSGRLPRRKLEKAIAARAQRGVSS